jgi:FAD/FMN-containing dehydrogenase
VSDLLAQLEDEVGARHVLVDGDLKAQYETDWTRRFTGSSLCVVRPASTAQVAAVVRACAGAGAPITVHGGNTGLVGGSVPAGGEVLLSLGRLTDLDGVDPLEAQVTAGAGVTLERLQQHARAAGLDFGVDLAARSAATVGGLVATNAGGLRVVRYGSMREQLTGIEAVLADGSVVRRLGGLTKDNTGYDLTQLLAGSEGTLAIITKVRLRLGLSAARYRAPTGSRHLWADRDRSHGRRSARLAGAVGRAFRRQGVRGDRPRSSAGSGVRD